MVCSEYVGNAPPAPAHKHVPASILAIGDNSVYLDADTHTMIATGHPQEALKNGDPGSQMPGYADTAVVGEQIGKELDARFAEPHWYDAKRFGEFVDLRVVVDDGGKPVGRILADDVIDALLEDHRLGRRSS